MKICNISDTELPSKSIIRQIANKQYIINILYRRLENIFKFRVYYNFFYFLFFLLISL